MSIPQIHPLATLNESEPLRVAGSADVVEQLVLDHCDTDPAPAPIEQTARPSQLRELPGRTWEDIFEEAA